MSTLGVIGNISRDIAVYADGRRHHLLGGAALHVARAAAAAGLPAAPISVIGPDLVWIREDPRLTSLDLTSVQVAAASSCVFRLAYTSAGALESVESDFGAASGITEHALTTANCYAHHHVCCRRPLDVARILRRLTTTGRTFSVDFHLASAHQLIHSAAEQLPQARAVFVNAAEFTTLATQINPRRLARVVVSDGPRQVTLLRHGHTVAVIRPPQASVMEVTGAGDTLAGTFLAHLAHGASDEEALRPAVTAATDATRHADLSIDADEPRR